MHERTWRLRGLDFTGLCWGQEGGIPTVFLHGYLDHAGSWSRVAEGLDGWRLALDLRGHGRSPHLTQGDTYHFPEYVADLDALVTLLGGLVNLVGQSMGGTIASIYAGARPFAVRRLAVLDGLGLHDSGEEAADRLVAFLDGVRDPPRNRTFPDVAAAAARLRHANRTLDETWAMELAARSTIPVPGGVTWSWDARHRIRGAVPYRQAHHQQLLRRIQCPVLSVHPELSPFHPADVAALEGCIAGLRVAHIEGAGHMVHLDAPEAVAAALRPFLADEAGSPPPP